MPERILSMMQAGPGSTTHICLMFLLQKESLQPGPFLPLFSVMLGKYCRQVFQPKRSSSKNRAGIAYATDPPLIKRGAG